ncbi:hypothetical protein MHB84_05470 [Paenibacillus sp. FSL F4-0087]|uniref:hypothetical protein n=1 Tax=Paenibacillus sp. FSL F4-0087 TaxID=2921368 RepID=UPI00096E2A9C|nr:hypothetical protein BK122_27400 [Paenibacillus pabuli]
MIFNKLLDSYDFFLQSEDKKSHILFSSKDVELERSKSINYWVHIKDDQFAGEVEIWIDYEELHDFIEELLEAENSEVKPIHLKAMNKEEFEMTFIDQSMGHYKITYSITKRRYSRSGLVETELKGSFDYDSGFLNPLKESLKGINRLLS